MTQPILTNCIIYSCFMQTKSIFCSYTSIQVRFFTVLSAYRVTVFSVYLFYAVLIIYSFLTVSYDFPYDEYRSRAFTLFLPQSKYNFPSICALLNFLRFEIITLHPLTESTFILLVTFAGVNSSVTLSSDKSSDKW